MHRSMISRRGFLAAAGAGLAGLTIPLDLSAAERAELRPVRLGVCADVHQDVMHDSETRIAAFVEEMNRQKPDFIIQLGDFCWPKPANQKFLDLWNGFAGPHYHVLGNHDTDGGFKRPQTVEFWGMTAQYYSFDVGGFHFVVLDGNDVKPEGRAPGYPRFIGREQLDWLAKDLAAAASPTIVFSHQSLEDPAGVENGRQVRQTLEAAAGKKVVAALSGHHHIDYHTTINGIAYVQINSMSYYWTGIENRASYTPEIHQNYPWISRTCPYKDPLFGMMTLDPAAGVMRLQGRESSYVGPSPEEVGYRGPSAEYLERVVPRISSWEMEMVVEG